LLTPQVLTAGRRRHQLTLALQAVGVTSVGEASLEVMLHRYLQVGERRHKTEPFESRESEATPTPFEH
jgi:hypothetical protein